MSEPNSIRMIDATVCKGDDDRDRRKSTFYPGENLIPFPLASQYDREKYWNLFEQKGLKGM